LILANGDLLLAHLRGVIEHLDLRGREVVEARTVRLHLPSRIVFAVRVALPRRLNTTQWQAPVSSCRVSTRFNYLTVYAFALITPTGSTWKYADPGPARATEQPWNETVCFLKTSRAWLKTDDANKRVQNAIDDELLALKDGLHPRRVTGYTGLGGIAPPLPRLVPATRNAQRANRNKRAWQRAPAVYSFSRSLSLAPRPICPSLALCLCLCLSLSCTHTHETPGNKMPE
jgi:hypothetical protein